MALILNLEKAENIEEFLAVRHNERFLHADFLSPVLFHRVDLHKVAHSQSEQWKVIAELLRH